MCVSLFLCPTCLSSETRPAGRGGQESKDHENTRADTRTSRAMVDTSLKTLTSKVWLFWYQMAGSLLEPIPSFWRLVSRSEITLVSLVRLVRPASTLIGAQDCPVDSRRRTSEGRSADEYIDCGSCLCERKTSLSFA